MSNDLKLLPVTTMKQAVEEAIQTVKEERSGVPLGLHTRFKKLNISKSKYFRFGEVTAIAGLSSHGKSYFLNLLRDDFLNPIYNPTFYGNVIVLSFVYEMKASTELIRAAGSRLNISYSSLISSEYIKDFDTFNVLSEDDFNKFKEIMELYKSLPIEFFEYPGTVDELVNTAKERKRIYSEKYPNRDLKFIITLDHTLLSKKSPSEKTEIDIISATSQAAMVLKKQGFAIIFLAQLNANIQSTERISNPKLHYPIGADIHGSNQLFWACDDVYILHQPYKLGITEYGPLKISNVANLIHLANVKARNGKLMDVFFTSHLSKGTIEELDKLPRIKTSQNF